MLDLLKGVRVVEMTTIILGPMAGQILADFGADVIKIEAPDGDLARSVAPLSASGESAMFVNCNRNKRSIAIDLKSGPGRKIVERMIADADVFLHNMRGKAVARLGLDAKSLQSINPRLIHCAAVGFGSTGPYADRPAYDDVIQAASGIANLPTRVGGEPTYVPGVVADKIAALYTAQAISAALYGRERSGRGLEIEVPMFEALTAFVMIEHLAAATFDAEGSPGYGRLFSRHRRPFATRDGWIAVLPYTGAHWTRTLTEIGREDVLAEPWFATTTDRSNRTGDLYAILGTALGDRTTDEWLATFERIDVPHSRVSELEDLLVDPHLASAGFFEPRDTTAGRVRSVPQPVTIRGSTHRPDRPAPALGADAATILDELGYTVEEVANFVAQGAVRAPLHNGED